MSSNNVGTAGITKGYSGTIVVFGGTSIVPTEPDPKDIYIEDIAHSLANQCRFTGHTRHFFSVGQHSIICSYLVPEEDALTALLHDATEAYLSDVARPIKKTEGFGEVYTAVEDNLWGAVAARFNLPTTLPQTVAVADELCCANEIRLLLPEHPAFGMWADYPKINDNYFALRSNEDVEAEFMARYNELGGSYAR